MKRLKSFVDKSISVSRLGGQWVSGLCSDIGEAAISISYLEGWSRKADTLHKFIMLSDEPSLNEAFRLVVEDCLKASRVKNVELAVDVTKDLYYGQEVLYTRGIEREHGASLAWEFAVISIVKPFHMPLMILSNGMNRNLITSVIDLLKYVQTLDLNIKKIYFDRGFYNWRLIDYLESAKLPYLIFLPRTSKIKGFIEQTKGKTGYYDCEGEYSKDKTKWKTKTKVLVCKKVWEDPKGKWHDMCFVTNLPPRHKLAKQYRKRWGIETGFRVMKEAKIKTKSNHPLVRLFYFMLRALLTLLWKMRQRSKTKSIFKIFLRAIRNYYWQQTLKTTKLTLKPPPPLKTNNIEF